MVPQLAAAEPFRGKTALITGASAGIGQGLARELHRRGADVILLARRIEALKRLSLELEELRANSTTVMCADLTKLISGASECLGLSEVVSYIESNRVDILVNNAGFGSFGYFDQLQLKRELEMIRLNVDAPVTLTHAVLPQLLERNAGGIIFLSSVAALQPLPYMATYAATKAFNLQHGLALRNEYRKTKLRFLTVCPGPVATEFGGVARVPGQMTNIHRDSVEQVVAEVLRAYERRASVVVPCARAKFIATLSSYLPKRLTAYLAERILRGSLPKN